MIIRSDIINILIDYFSVELIVRFGNRSEDAQDIDLLIVSNDFLGISNIKRKQLITKFDNRIDPVCLTSLQLEQLKKSRSSLYQSILSKHEILYGNPTNLL